MTEPEHEAIPSIPDASPREITIGLLLVLVGAVVLVGSVLLYIHLG